MASTYFCLHQSRSLSRRNKKRIKQRGSQTSFGNPEKDLTPCAQVPAGTTNTSDIHTKQFQDRDITLIFVPTDITS